MTDKEYPSTLLFLSAHVNGKDRLLLFVLASQISFSHNMSRYEDHAVLPEYF
jgi:hypothetical protein